MLKARKRKFWVSKIWRMSFCFNHPQVRTNFSFYFQDHMPNWCSVSWVQGRDPSSLQNWSETWSWQSWNPLENWELPETAAWPFLMDITTSIGSYFVVLRYRLNSILNLSCSIIPVYHNVAHAESCLKK